jgi:hypothetical protein
VKYGSGKCGFLHCPLWKIKPIAMKSAVALQCSNPLGICKRMFLNIISAFPTACQAFSDTSYPVWNGNVYPFEISVFAVFLSRLNRLLLPIHL